MLLGAFHNGDTTAADWLYPPLRDGVVRFRVYEADEFPFPDDHVVLTYGEQVGCIGRVTSWNGNRGGAYVSLREVWRPAHLKYPMATEAKIEYVALLVPRVPTFVDTGEADAWLRDARDLAVGDQVQWYIEVPMMWIDEASLGPDAEFVPAHAVTYEGKLIAIDEFDTPYWWENRPWARGKFKVLRIDSDGQPEISVVHEIMRYER